MYRIHIQNATEQAFVPTVTELRRWAKQTLQKRIKSAELTIRIIDQAEMTRLNETFRHKKGPTNVLSFPFDELEGVSFKVPPIGDLAICADVVNREAAEQDKSAEAHWAHMVVHGVLHLLGYDHQEESEAEKMETEEIAILQSFGFNDPYDLGSTP